MQSYRDWPHGAGSLCGQTRCMSKMVAVLKGLLPRRVQGKNVPSVMGLSALSRKPLQFEDMWRLPPQDRVANLAQRFETVWDKEQQKAKPSLVCHSSRRWPQVPLSVGACIPLV